MRLPPFAGPLLLGLTALGGCVANSGASSGAEHGGTGWDALDHVLGIDFSPPAAARRIASFRRLFDLPSRETARIPALYATAAAAPSAVRQRASNLLTLPYRGISTEIARTRALVTPGRLEALPSLDRIAVNTARDLERLGLLLGFEQRFLGESSDRRHRTDPDDDRPEMTIWQRLRRRLFP